MLAQSGNQYIAAQLAANSLAARAASSDSAGVTEKRVGDLVIKYSAGLQDAETYQALSKRFGRMAASQIAPYAGGISQSDKLDVERETDRVRPAFRRGLMDNKEAVDLATNLGGEST